jgi:flagellar motor component MotA
MTTLTIDIPDSNTEEVIAQLKKLGVKIRQSSVAKLDKLTKEDYEKHFSHRAEITKNRVLKYL